MLGFVLLFAATSIAFRFHPRPTAPDLIHLKVDEFRGEGGIITRLLGLGLPALHVGTVFRFDEAREALRALQGGRTVGKVVLVVGADQE